VPIGRPRPHESVSTIAAGDPRCTGRSTSFRRRTQCCDRRTVAVAHRAPRSGSSQRRGPPPGTIHGTGGPRRTWHAPHRDGPLRGPAPPEGSAGAECRWLSLEIAYRRGSPYQRLPAWYDTQANGGPGRSEPRAAGPSRPSPFQSRRTAHQREEFGTCLCLTRSRHRRSLPGTERPLSTSCA
jgi:hypothetical protein